MHILRSIQASSQAHMSSTPESSNSTYLESFASRVRRAYRRILPRDKIHFRIDSSFRSPSQSPAGYHPSIRRRPIHHLDNSILKLQNTMYLATYAPHMNRLNNVTYKRLLKVENTGLKLIKRLDTHYYNICMKEELIQKLKSDLQNNATLEGKQYKKQCLAKIQAVRSGLFSSIEAYTVAKNAANYSAPFIDAEIQRLQTDLALSGVLSAEQYHIITQTYSNQERPTPEALLPSYNTVSVLKNTEKYLQKYANKNCFYPNIKTETELPPPYTPEDPYPKPSPSTNQLSALPPPYEEDPTANSSLLPRHVNPKTEKDSPPPYTPNIQTVPKNNDNIMPEMSTSQLQAILNYPNISIPRAISPFPSTHNKEMPKNNIWKKAPQSDLHNNTTIKDNKLSQQNDLPTTEQDKSSRNIQQKFPKKYI